MRLPREAGAGMAAMLMRVVTPNITNITAITHITGIKGITGMHPAESDLLLKFLRSLLDDPNIQVRWHYEPHDLVMWDERCTNHRALGDHYPAHRIVRRCTVGASVPLGVSDSVS